MGPRKRKIMAFAASLAAIVLVVTLAAATAQAAEWTLKGKTFEELKYEGKEISMTGSGAFTLTVPKAKVSIKCTSQELSGAIVQGGTGKATSKFKECKVFDLEGKEVKSCPVSEPLTLTSKTELIEVGEKVYDKFSPATESSFGTIKFTAKECALGESLELTGTLAGESEAGERVKQPLVFSEAIATTTGTALKLGANPATPSGTSTISLGGEQAGQPWGMRSTFLESNPATPNFGEVKINTAATMVIKFTYRGLIQTAQLTAVGVQNESMVLFTNISETCENAQLTQGAFCQAEIKFEPKAVGEKTATLTVEEKGLFGRRFTLTIRGKGKL
jgi:hypothetical protein